MSPWRRVPGYQLLFKHQLVNFIIFALLILSCFIRGCSIRSSTEMAHTWARDSCCEGRGCRYCEAGRLPGPQRSARAGCPSWGPMSPTVSTRTIRIRRKRIPKLWSWMDAGTSNRGARAAVPSRVQCHLQCKQEQRNNGNNKNKKEEDTKIVKLDGCWDLKQGCQGSCPI